MIHTLLAAVAAVAVAVVATPAYGQSARTARQLGGVNVSGCEFKVDLCPKPADIAFYADAGATVIRLPVKGDRTKPETIKALVDAGTARGMVMIIDDHRYKNIGDPSVEAFWKRIGPMFKGNRLVAFDLQNEPNGGDWQTYGPDARKLIANLRAAGIDNQFLLEWRQSSGASRMDKRERHKLPSGSPDCASAICALNRLTTGPLDPLGKTWLSPHRYFDKGGSGTSPYCRSDLPPSGALGNSTAAARKYGYKLFLGEFAFGRAAGMKGGCSTLGPEIMAYLKANSDVWVGWTAWGGGRAWSPTYTFRIENSKDRAATWTSENGKLLADSWKR